ncbi:MULTISPECIES: class I SAM-dependent methyltransferase [Bacillus]|uniref:class I SAM-dependent methyltransferase n=1 Tax=Bacillus TaxID=1386 RepID=UPI0002EF74DE|nr:MULTISPECIES: class I SAM-dependent methyltransferase [Bacillus]
MIVTTGGRTNDSYILKAKNVAKDLQASYISRNKKSIANLLTTYDNVLIVGKDGLQLYNVTGNEPYFFHPNLAMIRVKRLIKGEADPFIDATGLEEGSSILDCTLGLAADSIVASFVVKERGHVIGVESSPVLSYMAKQGLQSWNDHNIEIVESMRRIQVVNDDHYSILTSMNDRSVDVVYFDPMFEESIEESNALQTISPFTNFSCLTEETIVEAKRVARKRVVLKDHFRSTRFQQFGFHQQIRKTAKFHYGIIEV